MRTLLAALSLLIGAQAASTAAADLAETAGMTALADSLRSAGVAEAAEVQSVTARQIDATHFRFEVVVLDDLGNEIEQVFVTFDDYTGPDPEPDDSFAMTEPTMITDDGTKVFRNSTLMFSDPAAAVGEVYTVIVDLRSAGGLSSLGSSFHQVVIERLEVDECTDGILNGAETAIDCGGGVCPDCGAPSDELLDEIRDVSTEVSRTASKTRASAHKVTVFSQNGNAKQLERAVSDTGEGLDDMTAQLGRLRRIGSGIIQNQYQVQTTSYGTRSSRLSGSWTTGSAEERAELAQEIVPLMGLIKNLAQDIRAEVMAMKNSSN